MPQYIFALEDQEDLMCLGIDQEPVSFKLAELFDEDMEIEELDFLNEIHETDKITEDMLQAAQKWWTECKGWVLSLG